MIDISKIKKVFFHASCPDGTASAVIVASSLGSHGFTAEFVPIQYGTNHHENIVPGDGQLFVDITPPIKRWEEWKTTDVIVLDHHETAEKAVLGLNGIYGTNDEWSGARLAYKYIYEPNRITESSARIMDDFSYLAMIRDTWKKNHDRWNEACNQANSLEFFGSEELLKRVAIRSFDVSEIMRVGEMLSDKISRSVAKYVRGANHSTVKDLKISFVNCTEKVQSEVGNALIENGSDITVCWFSLYEDEIRKFGVSLRGNGRVSVRKIAESMGGGGHDKAAGFSVQNSGKISCEELESMIIDRVLANYLLATAKM